MSHWPEELRPKQDMVCRWDTRQVCYPPKDSEEINGWVSWKGWVSLWLSVDEECDDVVVEGLSVILSSYSRIGGNQTFKNCFTLLYDAALPLSLAI